MTPRLQRAECQFLFRRLYNDVGLPLRHIGLFSRVLTEIEERHL